MPQDPRDPTTPEQARQLREAAEAWQDRVGWWGADLPPVLAAEHDRVTRQNRARLAFQISLIGSIVALLSTPTLLIAVPDMRWATLHLFLGGVVPFSFAVTLLMLSNPPPRVREASLGLVSICDGAVLSWIFLFTGMNVTQLYVAGMILLLLFATVTIQLRFRAAIGVTAALMAMFAIGVQSAPSTVPYFHQHLLLIYTVCGCYMLIANRRLQVEQQRAFVLAFRERLRGQDLFRRNLELDDLVLRDALTGLANRRAFDAWLLDSWRRAREAASPLGLIIIDVDRFKAYNDFYGHPAGDVCLQLAARCLRDQMRGTTDQVARLGGEEFAVLLPGLTCELCGDVAERLRAAVAALELPHIGSVGVQRGGAVLTISCGAASLRAEDRLTPADLVAAADAAMYQAKEAGRNQVYLADTGHTTGATADARHQGTSPDRASAAPS